MDAPDTFRAGDSVSWTESFSDYPASAGWSIKYRLLYPAAGVAQDITTAASGDDHTVNLSAATTAEWTAGTATLVCIAENAAQRATVGNKSVVILPDLAVIGTFDGRSLNKRTLDDLEAALAAYAAAGQGHVEEYEVAGRRMKFRAVDEIEVLIRRYRRLVAKEVAAQILLNGGEPPGRCYYRG